MKLLLRRTLVRLVHCWPPIGGLNAEVSDTTNDAISTAAGNKKLLLICIKCRQLNLVQLFIMSIFIYKKSFRKHHYNHAL